ncbi:MAG: protein kinase [Myxococcales bacterium]|jgi:serine/threonine-protein kinase|nr:protein kinase [Myxococcales bacterium]MBL0198220.1 protein kinase [Myxococcales bacterium]
MTFPPDGLAAPQSSGAPDATLGPCPSCGTPLDGLRACTICGHVLPDPRIGTVLAGKYRLDSVLGEGGMGIVYRATHVELGEPLAVKFLKAAWAARPEFRARFRREAVILARLRHPGIVSVLDFGELGGELYMAMELIAGVALADVIAKDKTPIARLRVAPIFDELLAVIEAAHDAGIVHRDLKPENVMLVPAKDRAERVKVLDFGIAFLAGEEGAQRLTETGTVRGTPHYMAPEQCKGVHVGPEADIYAVGIMLFEALTGTTPFDSSGASGLMVQHMFVDPPRLAESGVKPEVSRGLEELVARALAKRPEDRPTARAMREELTSVFRGTDFAAFADRGALERSRMAALSRSDRAITGVGEAASAGGIAPVATGAAVVLWLDDPDRASELRSALAVHGLYGHVHLGDSPPGPDVAAGRTVKALVIGRGDATGDAVLVARGRGPLLAVGARDAEDTARLVRGGASDVALASAANDEIVKKIMRLVRRGR